VKPARGEQGRGITVGAGPEAALAKAVVKAKVAGAHHYYITTFFYPPVRKPNTSLHPPVLRPEILAARGEPGGHVLVYQTSTSNQALPDILKACGRECRIYGLRRGLQADVVDGNLVYRPFSEAGFIDDLRTARAVVAGGGYTLMSEAVYLHKPLLSLPVQGQFEQTLNALYLQKLGYGRLAETLDERTLHAFLTDVPRCAEALKGYAQDGNRSMFEALDRQLELALEER